MFRVGGLVGLLGWRVAAGTVVRLLPPPPPPPTDRPPTPPARHPHPATMFRPRCAPLRRLLICRPPLLPACSAHLRLAAAAAASAQPQPTRTRAPASPRTFSSTPPAAIKNDGHFPKDLYDSIAESTIDGILMSLEQLCERRADIDVEYSVSLPLPSLPTHTHALTPARAHSQAF